MSLDLTIFNPIYEEVKSESVIRSNILRSEPHRLYHQSEVEPVDN